MPNNNLLKVPITDGALIKKLLPHREPMLMVDGLLYFHGTKAVAELTVLETNIFVENNIFAETGIIEHMAQTAALMIGYKYDSENLPVKEGFIATIKNLKIEIVPILNDTISTEATITYEMANMTNVTLVSKRKNEVLASAEMTLVLKENE
jgi:predicted hotdog family 3-hydroxylacyl-ACP dehydratase